jgi:hypothetical protein
MGWKVGSAPAAVKKKGREVSDGRSLGSTGTEPPPGILPASRAGDERKEMMHRPYPVEGSAGEITLDFLE